MSYNSSLETSTDETRTDIERLIHRVRTMIDLGLSIDEIVEACADHHPGGEIYLAYQAAKILASDTAPDNVSTEK